MRHFLRIKLVEREIKTQNGKELVAVVVPAYRARSQDLMRKGGDFYAVVNPATNMWSTNPSDLVGIIDDQLYSYREKIAEQDGNGDWRTKSGKRVLVDSIDDSTTGRLKQLNQWMNNLSPNHAFVPLDTDITFVDEEVKPEDYRSKRLKYKIAEGTTEAYDKIFSVLYSPENLKKIEWSIGSIFTGDSKKIEKLLVLYGDPGTGKSTLLDLIKSLLDGYWAPFVASELASKAFQFSTSAFKDNPLAAIQDDGSLAKIDSPVINEIVSHKETMINEKNMKQYPITPHAFLFLATNEVVDIHDTKLGITRRLLDVYPSGKRLPVEEYEKLKSRLKFELGAIAYHCIQVYKEMGKNYYEGYEPYRMIQKSNYLRNFVFDYFDRLEANDPITRDTVYSWYKEYFEASGLGYPPKRIIFGDQLKEYYKEYSAVGWIDGKTKRHIFSGFRRDKALYDENEDGEVKNNTSASQSDSQSAIISWLTFNSVVSIFDKVCSDCLAQLANDEEKPYKKWENVKTKLSQIDTHKVHYVRVPENHIVIDFDLKDADGNKSFELNLAEALKWPPTYAELSKSGGGIHLHYIYQGDASQLSRIYAEGVEIKVFTGNSSLRRKLTKCNDLPIATISSNLPLKGEKKLVSKEVIKNEKQIRKLITDCIRKKHHGATKPEIDFIVKILDDAYASGITYDVSNMHQAVLTFAMGSTNQSAYCLEQIPKMKFRSEEMRENKELYSDEAPLVFFDVEVFPNLFVVVYKMAEASCIKLINPTAEQVEDLFKYRLVGFNNRRYDNHILYARSQGYTNQMLYDLSNTIINGNGEKGGRRGMFGEAYNLSYTDVYDFASKKQSLKKWEIELEKEFDGVEGYDGVIKHQELDLPWNEPVPEDKWDLVAEYCCNDVIATEVVFNNRHEDFVARQILAEISGLTVNDTTNSHTTKLIVGDDKNPQTKFVYTDLATMFPGYVHEFGKSTYMGEEVGEGGYVYAEQGMYTNIALLDVASMHPTSIDVLNLFGDYTDNFRELKNARLAIKHGDFETAGKMFGGKLTKYLKDKDQADSLAYALKIAINSVYGLTAAKFDNRLRDPRNVDNIVAKRGALFMVNLKLAVQEKGFTVAHIKTDSIKIPNATPEIIQFVMDYGKSYGYTFEHEATYERMCLVNDAVYIAKYKDGKHAGEWTATGAQFAHPVVFKRLFSKEPIKFVDLCETKTVSTALYLDMNEGLDPEEHRYQFVGRAGLFCPVKDGCGGGLLCREKDGKYYAATGTKGYRWLEADVVKSLGLQDSIDERYFQHLVNEAVDNISKYGDFEWFVSGDPWQPLDPNFMNPPSEQDEELPFN